MHIQLTDILTCPACGPEHGLIVRADRIVERRVREGVLGCPQCRRQYAIREGVAWLVPGAAAARAPVVAPAPSDAAAPAGGADTGPGLGQGPARAAASDAEEAVRIAALLGLGAGRASGFVAIVGSAAARAADLAALVEGQEVVALDAQAATLDDAGSVSRVVMDTTLPFYAAKLRGVWLSGDGADALLEEAVRALHPMGRLVLEPAPPDAHERLAARGMHVLAHEQSTLVAARS